MNCLKTVPSRVVFFCALTSGSVLAQDYTSWLGDTSFKVVQHLPPQATEDSKPEEAYVAKDQYGNEYVLRIEDPAANTTRIGTSLLKDALGVTNATTFPIFVRRGENGLPEVSEAKKLFSGFPKKREWPGAGGDYVRATLQVRSRSETRPTWPEFQKYGGQLVASLIIDFVLGKQPTRSGEALQTLKLANGSIVETNATPLFSSKIDLFGRYFLGYETLDFDRANLTTGFMHEVNTYLTRLEKMPEDQLATLFPQLRTDDVLRKQVMDRIKTARPEFVSWLERRGYPQTVRDTFLTQEPDVSPPHISIPKTTDLKGSSENRSARAILWDLYYAATPAAYNDFLSSVSQSLNVRLKTVMTVLRSAVAKDPHIYFVGPHMRPDLTRAVRRPVAQVGLNPLNPKTLLVITRNDAEAAEMINIAKTSGLHVMELRTAEEEGKGTNHYGLRHGTFLADSFAGDIAAEAKRVGATRIVLSELPGETPGFEARLSKLGGPDAPYEVIPVDHHKNGKVDRRHPLSSLEQFADVIGYKLSPSEKAVGVLDRSGNPGLRDLGVPDDIIRKFSNPRLDLLERLRPQNGIYDIYFGPLEAELFPEDDGRFRFMKSAGRIDAATGGNHRGIVSFGRSNVRFYGPDSTVQKLDALGKKYQDRTGEQYSGGDVYRNSFWTLTKIPDDLLPSIYEEVSAIVGVNFQPPASSLVDMRNATLRSELLARMRWEKLSSTYRSELIAYAATSTSPRDIQTFLKWADATREPEWSPLLIRWRDHYQVSEDGSKGIAQSAAALLNSIQLVSGLKSVCPTNEPLP